MNSLIQTVKRILNPPAPQVAETRVKPAKRSILHMFDPMPNNSPFDVNMALDAGFDVLMPYANVKLDSVTRLTQDAIFSRSLSGVKRTAIFIGGRDIGLAVDMLEACASAMTPPFQVSALADPSGAYTTAAALVACVEKGLRQGFDLPLAGRKVLVFGGTGPVGLASAVIAALQGAETTIVDHLSLDSALDLSKQYHHRFNANLHGAVAQNNEQKAALLADAEVVFCTAKAGVRVLSTALLAEAKALKVVGDVNAVPPSGIEGVNLRDFATPLPELAKTLAVGALAVGDVKYKTQQALLQSLLTGDAPRFLDFRAAFDQARSLV